MQVLEEQEKQNRAVEQVIVFEVIKRAQYGRAVFVCGSLKELGEWNTKQAVRLEWGVGDRWRGRVGVANRGQRAEFKFLEGPWECAEGRVEWQIGNCNRRIQLGWSAEGPLTYFAQWNMQHYIFLLRTQDFEERESYFMSGSVAALGGWRERRAMRRLGSEKGNPFLELCRNNPEFAEEAAFSRIFMYAFSAGREVDSFAYHYAALGDSLDTEGYPGRTCRLAGSSEHAPDRVAEFDWEGSRVVIDECNLDKMILQRFSNTIYLASRLQPAHFPRLLQVHPSALLLLIASSEDYCPATSTLRALARDHGLVNETILLDQIDTSALTVQLQRAVEVVEELLEHGHRVVLHVSSRVMRLFPTHMLYLILFAGYSFGEALELLSEKERPGEEACRHVRELYNFISSKLRRGRVEVKQ